METEEWKYIPGYEGQYQVSNHGRVKSVARSVRSSHDRFREIPEIIMSQQTHNNGYKVVFLRRPPNEHRKFFVHRLVAAAFDPQAHPGTEVHHLDHDRTNNRIDNLRWITHSENIKHAWARKQQLVTNEAF